MRILHLVGAHGDNGGVLSVIRSLQEVTRSADWDHVVAVNQVYKEVRSPPLVYRWMHHLHGESSNHLFLLLKAVCAYRELKRLLHRERFDVLHAHLRGAMLVVLLVARLQRRPVLFTNHGYARRRRLYQWAARRPRVSTVVLTPNMARYYGLAGWPNVDIVSECCADRFFAEPLAESGGAVPRGSAIRLVGLGNVVRWKNWQLLLQALAHLTGAERVQLHFDQWGPAPQDRDTPGYQKELRQFIRDHRLEPTVQFHGPSSSVADGLRHADWFALPSTNEPCSVALIEALALGVPALVSASGGNVDIVQPGRTGLWFEPENVSDLVAKLRAILARQVQPLPPTQIRESVRHRSATQVAAEYERIYRRLCVRPAA